MVPGFDIDLAKASAGDMDALIRLDQIGVFPGSDETPADFSDRIARLREEIEKVDKQISVSNGTVSIDSLEISVNSKIPLEHYAETAEHLRRYEFSIDWVPGFYTSKSLPFLCGGCSLVTDTGLPFFILKFVFALKKRWLIYSRNELIAHELCHIARMPIEGEIFEELFAYRISSSRLRRFFGSCFRSGKEHLYLIIPIIILLMAQVAQITCLPGINLLYFILLALICPVWLLIRNHFTRKVFHRARMNLESYRQDSPDTDAILFRCTDEEIRSIARIKGGDEFREWIGFKSSSSLRWKIISSRFFRI